MSAVFGCSTAPGERRDERGLHLVGDDVAPIVSRLADRLEGPDRQPRFYAEGRMVVTAHTGRRVTPPQAREALHYEVEGVLATTQDDLVDGDILRIADLIRAIRAAERQDPTPPAQAMRTAA